MFSIQRYNVDQQKIGGPCGVFYTTERAKQVAEQEDKDRELDGLQVQHFQVVPVNESLLTREQKEALACVNMGRSI